MDDQICQHYNYGYCKFQKHFKKIHEEGQCDALAGCKEIKTFNKRHPKVCKRLSRQKFCKFGMDCAYLHVHSEVSEQETVERYEETVREDITNMKAEISE